METEITTKEEMTEFIEGLFKTSNPKVDPSWSLAVPDASCLDESVEFASKQEVDEFITGLFKKS